LARTKREWSAVRSAHNNAEKHSDDDRPLHNRLSRALTTALPRAEHDATPTLQEPACHQLPPALAALGLQASELTPNVRSALARLTDQIKALQADRVRINQKLREAEDLADADTLVPVFNRRAFVRELTRVISFAGRYGVQASIVYFDLDGFKQINDRFGHAAGDLILKAVGQTLLANIRESDLVGRVGGDEFAVILAKAGPDDARTKGAQLAGAISQARVSYLGQTLSVGAAFGAYCFEHGDTAERALSRADEAMYAHKVGRKVQSL
jgi:diguanylate cyclase (GGDEF)-like protein